MTALKPRGAASSAFFLVATSAVVRGEVRSYLIPHTGPHTTPFAW